MSSQDMTIGGFVRCLMLRGKLVIVPRIRMRVWNVKCKEWAADG
jgi:hypothetical protein